MPNQIRNIPSYNPAATDTPFGIFELFVRQYMNGHLAVLQPVEITSIGASGKFVNVKPLIGHYTTENKPIPITDADIIPNIPYMHPFSANGRMAFPPAVGDQGLLIACNFDTTNYKATHSATTTNTGRTFNWSDGFFLPLSFQDAPANFLFENGGSSVEITKSEINVESGQVNVTAPTVINGDVLVNGNIVATGEVTAGQVNLTTHTHPVPAASALTPPPAPTPASLAPLPG